MVGSFIENMLLDEKLFYVFDTVLLFLAFLLWRLRWRDYFLSYKLYRTGIRNREVSDPGSEQAMASLPEKFVWERVQPLRLSVVVPGYNQAGCLEQNLPVLLEQEFEHYEVIVVMDESSTDDTKDVLERLEKRYPHLRHTFVPATARYVSRRKLAVTLGVRAARSPWVLFTCADALPASPHWLSRMSAAMTDDSDFVLGCAGYEDDGTAAGRRARYERQVKTVRDLRAAYSGKAIGGDVANWAVRKSFFLENRGYADSLTVPFGETDSLLDALSRKGRTSLEVHPDSLVVQALPSEEILRADRICLREVQLHLGRRSRMYLWRDSMAALAVYLFVATLSAYLAARFMAVSVTGVYDWPELCADAGALFAVVLSLTLSFVARRRFSTATGTCRFGLPAILFYSLWLPLANQAVRFRRWRSRHDFVRR